MLLEPWVRNWDEAWYAEIIKQMAVGGKGWLMPWWNGQYYFDHPPVYFWLSGLVVKLFGLGEWQVRIVSVLAGIGVATVVEAVEVSESRNNSEFSADKLGAGGGAA